MGVEVPGGAETGGSTPSGLTVIAEQLTLSFKAHGIDTTAARLLLEQLFEKARVFSEDDKERWYHGEVQPREGTPARTIFLVERYEDTTYPTFLVKVFHSAELPPSPDELHEEATRKALRQKLIPRSSRDTARALVAAAYVLPTRQQTINVIPSPEYL